MDSKPIVLTDDHTLVAQDLSNVYAHWLIENPPIISQHDVKFKKKENIDSLKKSMLKHRIRVLTGKVSFGLGSNLNVKFCIKGRIKASKSSCTIKNLPLQ